MADSPATRADLIACPDCDLLLRVPIHGQDGLIQCPRCRAALRRQVSGSLDKTLAFTLTGLVFFILANSFPFLSLNMGGRVTENTLVSGVLALNEGGMPALGLLVFFTSLLAPLLQLLLLLHILVPLKLGRRPLALAASFRWLAHLSPWGMVGVYMLGTLVAIVKLQDLAAVLPGTALFSLGGLILAAAGTKASLDPEMIWRRAEEVA